MSHEPSEIKLKCRFGAEETFLIITNLKTAVPNIFVETVIFFVYISFSPPRIWRTEMLREQHLFEREIFYNKCQVTSLISLLILLTSNIWIVMYNILRLYYSSNVNCEQNSKPKYLTEFSLVGFLFQSNRSDWKVVAVMLLFSLPFSFLVFWLHVVQLKQWSVVHKGIAVGERPELNTF